MTLTNRYFDVIYTVPPGTLPTSPLVVEELTLGDVMLNDLNLRIPPGHAGQTGFQVQYGGSVIFPWENSAAFVVDDNQDYDFVVGIEVDLGLEVVLFNMGLYPHSFYVRWNTTPMSLLQPSAAAAFSPIVQSSAPSSGIGTTAYGLP